MRHGKAKTKTAVMTLRVSPAIRAAAKQAADQEHRSVTNLVEVLIMDRCKALNIPLETNTAKETVQ
jgi:hypothetical protein